MFYLGKHDLISWGCKLRSFKMEIKSFFYTFTNILSNPLMKRPFFKVSNFHVLTEDMDSGGERLGGQMFGRCRRVLSVLLLINILWLGHFLIAWAEPENKNLRGFRQLRFLQKCILPSHTVQIKDFLFYCGVCIFFYIFLKKF